jgi:hypothetical protein
MGSAIGRTERDIRAHGVDLMSDCSAPPTALPSRTEGRRIALPPCSRGVGRSQVTRTSTEHTRVTFLRSQAKVAHMGASTHVRGT